MYRAQVPRRLRAAEERSPEEPNSRQRNCTAGGRHGRGAGSPHPHPPALHSLLSAQEEPGSQGENSRRSSRSRGSLGHTQGFLHGPEDRGDTWLRTEAEAGDLGLRLGGSSGHRAQPASSSSSSHKALLKPGPKEEPTGRSRDDSNSGGTGQGFRTATVNVLKGDTVRGRGTVTRQTKMSAENRKQ